MPENPFDDYIDLDQAARDLEVHQQTVRRQIKGGNLTATKIGGNYWIQLDKYRQFKANYLEFFSSNPKIRDRSKISAAPMLSISLSTVSESCFIARWARSSFILMSGSTILHSEQPTYRSGD